MPVILFCYAFINVQNRLPDLDTVDFIIVGIACVLNKLWSALSL